MLSFPSGPRGWLCLVALVPLFWALPGAGIRRGGILGVVAGAVFFGIHLRWALLFGWHAWGALIATQAVAIGVFGAMAGKLRRTPGVAAAGLPALWVLADAARTRFPLGGFAFGQLAYSQVDTALRSVAGVGGAVLVTGVVAAVNSLLAAGLLAGGDDGLLAGGRWAFGKRAMWAGLGLGLVAVTAGIGWVGKSAYAPTADGDLRLAVIQPYDFDRGLSSEERETQLLLRRFESATKELGSGYTLVIWPEGGLQAADPGKDPATLSAAGRSAMAAHAYILANGQPLAEDGLGFYNRNYLFDPEGRLVDSSDKEHLVPFGEYVPWRSALSGWVTAIDKVPIDGRAGEAEPFDVGTTRVGSVICFESAFSEPVRSQANKGAALIVVETNNRSFGTSELSRQHLATSRLRAVETGRPVIHAAISGISAAIGPEGEILGELGLFERGALSMDAQPRAGKTLYMVIGDWPVLVAAVLLGTAALLAPWRSRRPAPGEGEGEASSADG